jgi:hypothetical protein
VVQAQFRRSGYIHRYGKGIPYVRPTIGLRPLASLHEPIPCVAGTVGFFLNSLLISLFAGNSDRSQSRRWRRLRFALNPLARSQPGLSGLDAFEEAWPE